MKTIRYILLGVILLVGGRLLYHVVQKQFRSEPVYIAVVGPMSGPDAQRGAMMVNGINLYLDELQHDLEDTLGGRKIELLIFDDQNDTQLAAQIATDIARENKVLLVLGHYNSLASIAAGNIYKRAGIPAITASVTDERVTVGNEWYFSIFPTARFQMIFAANYIRNIFPKKAVSIIFDNENWDVDILNYFEQEAGRLGIDIRNVWTFGSQTGRPNEQKIDAIKGIWDQMQLNGIITAINALDEPQLLFFITRPREAVEILTSINTPKTAHTIFGIESFLSEKFLQKLQEYPEEQENPGYYSDDVYFISPVLGGVHNEKAFFFQVHYRERYQEHVPWRAALYYDAIHVALNAIEKADIRGEGYIRSDRRKVKDALASFYNPETAVRGVIGDIYFDQQGNSKRDIAVGVYQNQKILHSFLQYQVPFEPDKIEDAFRRALNGDLILVDGQIMTEFQVVYAGIAINDIVHFDEQNSICTLDFYLWFRFQGDFQDTEIKFLNAVTPVTLDTPILEETSNDITTRIYRIQADFKGNIASPVYLLNYEAMSIKFHHATQTREHLVYFVDELGIPPSLALENSATPLAQGLITGFSLYESSVSTLSTLGIYRSNETFSPISFSQITAQFLVKRLTSHGILQQLALLVGLSVFLYLIYFLSPARLKIRLTICLVMIVFSAWIYGRVISFPRMQFFINLEYIFFVVYFLIVVTMFFTILSYSFQTHSLRKGVRWLSWSGRILYPLLVIIGFLSWLVYMVMFYFKDNREFLIEIARYFSAMM